MPKDQKKFDDVLALLEEGYGAAFGGKHFDLQGCGLTDEDALILARHLRRNHSVAGLNLSDNEIGTEGAEAICKALASHSMITTLNFSGNPIGDGGVQAIVERVQATPSIRHLELEDAQITHLGASELARMLIQCPELVTLKLKGNDLGDGNKELEIACIGSQHKNLCFVSGIDGVDEHVRGNKSIAQNDLDLLNFFKPGRESGFNHFGLHARLPAIEAIFQQFFSNNNAARDGILSFRGYLNEMPTLDLSEPITMEDLTTKRGEHAPIDNPLVWRHFDQVVAALNDNDIYLRKEALIDEEGQPTDLLKQARKAHQVKALFIKGNWEGADIKEFEDVVRALGDMSITVPNLHQIKTSLIRRDRAEGQGRER